MASTPEGQRLTEEHRQAQQDVRDDFLAEFLALWVLLDTARLDDTGPGWLAAVVRLIREFRWRSSVIATRYYWEFRATEVPAPQEVPLDMTPRPGGPVSPPAGPRTGRPPRADTRPPRSNRRERIRRAERELDRALEGSGIRWDFDDSALDRPRRDAQIEIDIPEIDWSEIDRKVEIDLTIAGPVGQKSKIGKGKTPREARDLSFVESSGAATRHVLTGGRQSLLTLIKADTKAHRWIRVTDGDPCYFCAMLASRGPVYVSEASAGFRAHDHCACTAEPVYSRNTLWPGRAAEFRRLWRQHIERRYSGDEAIREWRRIYTELQREARRAG